MVVMSLKQVDGDGFLFETTTDTLNDVVIKSLVDIHNCRIQSRFVIDAVRRLVSYGPMKKPNDNGFEEVSLDMMIL